MIGMITFWNMKKIGEYLEMRQIMITTFRAFATGVRELKNIEWLSEWMNDVRVSMYLFLVESAHNCRSNKLLSQKKTLDRQPNEGLNKGDFV